ncbi:MAG: hypothetical protein MUE83_17795 [Tabrizicola sp.]|nr:hypothetical protein [Tabrizicola sp.]
MQAFVLTMFAALSPVSFDASRVIGLFHPDREWIVLTASNGTEVTYLCKAGAAGETPQEQAEKAQLAFETNLTKFAEGWTAEMMSKSGEGDLELSQTLGLALKMDSWAKAITTHLEKEYGCMLIG